MEPSPSRWDALRSRSRSGSSAAWAFESTRNAGPSRQRTVSATASATPVEFDVEQFASAAVSRLRARSGLYRRVSPSPSPMQEPLPPIAEPLVGVSPPLHSPPRSALAPPENPNEELALRLSAAYAPTIAASPNEEWYGFYDPSFFGPAEEPRRASRGESASSLWLYAPRYA